MVQSLETLYSSEAVYYDWLAYNLDIIICVWTTHSDLLQRRAPVASDLNSYVWYTV